MGGFFAYRVNNYDNTAEREQFRFLCERLKVRYEKSEEFCIIVGNYNIGVELDALLIKRDAIIVVEFKNYGGHIMATENGEWMCDDTPIKGGSRKTVLQQARINHTTVKRELKLLGVDKKQIKDIPTLIIFHQPIDLDNRLSATNKSWLHITDDAHAIEKIEDITCPNTTLSEQDVVGLAERLNIEPFYINDFGDLPKISEITMTKEPNNAESATTITTKKLNDSESKEIIDFCRMGLDGIIDGDYDISITDGLLLNELNAPRIWEYVIVISKQAIGDYINDIASFFQTVADVYKADNDTLYMGYGKIMGIKTTVAAPTDPSAPSLPKQSSYKSLPKYLDELIFGGYYGAKYQPDFKRYTYNKDLDEEELLTYLGTYFPRSYCESFCIFNDVFSNEDYERRIQESENITILDIGCGSGGEIIGLLEILEQRIPQNLPLDIYTFDGNAQVQDILMDLIGQFQKETNSPRQIQIYTNITDFINEATFAITAKEIETMHFDFIMCNKMCNELISKHHITDAYYNICQYFAPLLSKNGVLCLLDVTTRDEKSGCFYPMLLNQQVNRFTKNNSEFSTVMPLSCANHSDCNNLCFTERKYYVTHSMKEKDLSKVAFRLICRKELQDKFDLSDFENEIINESAQTTDAKAHCPLNKNN